MVPKGLGHKSAMKTFRKRLVTDMKMSFRWYGESDPISLEYIRQIPNMRSVVTAVYDVKPGEVWPEEIKLDLRGKY